MKQITVKELFKMCAEQVMNGKGNRAIVISDDNEGNGFHGLFYGFSEITEEEKEYFPIYDTQEDEVNKILVLG